MRGLPSPLRSAVAGAGYVAVLALGTRPPAAYAQAAPRDEDARVPGHGIVWLEVVPSFAHWNEQFTEDGSGPDGGSSEPLFSDFDGPLAGRLFPGLDPLLADVNRDAAALGYDSVTAADLALGSLEFGTIDKEVRSVAFALSVGLFGRLSLDAALPLVQGRVKTDFRFDGSTARFVPAAVALPNPDGLFGPAAAARSDLEALVAGGGLDPAQEAFATELLDRSGAFTTALQDRVDAGTLLPTAPSPAGAGMAATWGELAAGFESFGLALPELPLPDSAGPNGLSALLAAPPIQGDPLGDVDRGWSTGDVEIGLRLKLLDTFGSVPRPAEGPYRRTREPDLRGSGLRLRTTVGARVRLPTASADADPNLVPTTFLQLPVSDGQTDVEVAVWQDVQVGSLLWLVAAVRRTWQLEDDLEVRIAPAGRPFAFAGQQRVVSRDLGDRFAVRVSPRLRLDETVGLGLEYLWESKDEDTFTAQGAPDPSPLSVRTEEERHRLGIGVYYRTSPRRAAGLARLPIEAAFIWQTSIAGDGGLTPDSDVFSLSFRVPIGVLGS
ncbi:MAG: hypothetical protein RRA92_03060 [Gemmatimonadota bacterium]|nr:hypothetical protein [Gemmatimonadota bacterium]